MQISTARILRKSSGEVRKLPPPHPEKKKKRIYVKCAFTHTHTHAHTRTSLLVFFREDDVFTIGILPPLETSRFQMSWSWVLGFLVCLSKLQVKPAL